MRNGRPARLDRWCYTCPVRREMMVAGGPHTQTASRRTGVFARPPDEAQTRDYRGHFAPRRAGASGSEPADQPIRKSAWTRTVQQRPHHDHWQPAIHYPHLCREQRPNSAATGPATRPCTASDGTASYRATTDSALASYQAIGSTILPGTCWSSCRSIASVFDPNRHRRFETLRPITSRENQSFVDSKLPVPDVLLAPIAALRWESEAIILLRRRNRSS